MHSRRVFWVAPEIPAFGTRRALAGSMHTLLFSLRRADLQSLAFQRSILREFGITPARYLMLFVIGTIGLHLGEKSRWMLQRDIRRELGVSRMTVSVMLRSLEAELWVKRTKQRSGDKRQVVVQLTERAMRLLRDVHRKVIRPGVIWFAIYTAFGMAGQKVGALKYWADRFREKFDDPSTFYYPWCARTLYPSRMPKGKGNAIAQP
jgi:DNA-binding MarR family transcriptional regulator